jgi:pimeloyl-ACP methyl ester carboxylesterase
MFFPAAAAALVAVAGLTAASAPLAIPAAGAASTSAAARSFAPTRFSVTVVGKGPDVLLVPGLTASRDVWDETVAALPGYRYHLLQVAGFAGEPARGNAEGALLEPIADEIARYIREARLDRPAIVGHSMGGTLAMLVAARHPDVAGKVMVVDIMPQPAALVGFSAPGLRGLADSLREMGRSPGGRQLIASLAGMFGPPENGGRPNDPDVVARATYELAVADLTPQLSRIRAPLTIVYATDSNVADPAALHAAFASAYAPKKDARLVPIDRSGHMVMRDRPERFRAALSAFLRS